MSLRSGQRQRRGPLWGTTAALQKGGAEFRDGRSRCCDGRGQARCEEGGNGKRKGMERRSHTAPGIMLTANNREIRKLNRWIPPASKPTKRPGHLAQQTVAMWGNQPHPLYWHTFLLGTGRLTPPTPNPWKVEMGK
eukprot:CCRYP_012246-RA/>CCRYP_012246-RA protein AED:0.42 eAED:0.42 QI:0/-1/0/1/-1/1/1/0/135